jgi:uncharacterized protein
MTTYRERTYRRSVSAKDLQSYRVAVRETDLRISSDGDMEQEARDLVFEYRLQLENYIASNPEFATTLLPYPPDPLAPAMIRDMIDVSGGLGVGPMASVAGAIAQYVGEGLLRLTRQVIVENGGDIFLKADRRVTVSIFAGESPFSEKLGLLIPEGQMPLGVCSSSAVVGHSLSMGVADVVCLLSSSALLADAGATAVGNRIRGKEDLKDVSEWADKLTGVLGGVAIVDDAMAAWGDVELVEI